MRGESVEALRGFLEEEKVELLVTGTHGFSGMKRLLLGSVSEQVLHRVDCPVLVVKRRA